MGIKIEAVITAVNSMRTAVPLMKKMKEDLRKKDLSREELELIAKAFTQLSTVANESLSLLESLFSEKEGFRVLFIRTEADLRERIAQRKDEEEFCTAWEDQPTDKEQ